MISLGGKWWTRDELFKAVWSKPGVHIARELGISETAIRHACERHMVPRPSGWHNKGDGTMLPNETRPILPRIDSIPSREQIEARRVKETRESEWDFDRLVDRSRRTHQLHPVAALNFIFQDPRFRHVPKDLLVDIVSYNAGPRSLSNVEERARFGSYTAHAWRDQLAPLSFAFDTQTGGWQNMPRLNEYEVSEALTQKFGHSCMVCGSIHRTHYDAAPKAIYNFMAKPFQQRIGPTAISPVCSDCLKSYHKTERKFRRATERAVEPLLKQAEKHKPHTTKGAWVQEQLQAVEENLILAWLQSLADERSRSDAVG